MKTTFRINLRATIWLLFATGAVILALTGCDSKVESGFATADDGEEETLVTPEPLNLLAIGVPGFNEDVSRLWAAERDGDLKISHMSVADFESKVNLPGDVDLFVHPAASNVDLISKDLIRVFPRDGLVSNEMNMEGFLSHFRKALVRHNDETWSVSLGGQQLRLLYRRDVLKAADIDPPDTWEELDRAIEKLKDAEAAKGLAAIVVPTGGEMGSRMLMARVASQIRDQGKLTSFFDRKTMKPMVASEPFVKALSSLKALVAESGGTFTVGETFEKFAAGEAVFAVAWPVASEKVSAESIEANSANWGVARLPGSSLFYDLKESNWFKRRKGDDGKVDLLGIAANNISISSRTSNAKDATEFVAWLADKRNSQKLLLDVAAPFRATHLARIGTWYSMEQADRTFLNAMADSIEETHKSRIFLMFPQLPGTRQYLSLLDDAVVKFLAGDSSDAKKVLEGVAKDWDELTESLGRESQVKELRQGNGI